MNRMPPNVVYCASDTLPKAAFRLLHERAERTLLCRAGSVNAMEVLGRVDCLFSDIDGTLAEEGAQILPARIVAYLRRLHSAGVTITLVSGKPFEEVAPLARALPADLPLGVIYEKGAYSLRSHGSKQESQDYLLSTPELEQTVAALRSNLTLYWQAVVATRIHERASFGWAGSGKHKSLLSIDIFTDNVPEHYERLTGADRDQLKLKDTAVLSKIASELQAFTNVYCPGWQVVHLGNANFEIAPVFIDKDMAIQQTHAFQAAEGVLILGDSGNDRNMFALRMSTKVAAGLVLHSPAAADLIQEADFITFGMANPYPLLACLLEAKS